MFSLSSDTAKTTLYPEGMRYVARIMTLPMFTSRSAMERRFLLMGQAPSSTDLSMVEIRFRHRLVASQNRVGRSPGASGRLLTLLICCAGQPVRLDLHAPARPLRDLDLAIADGERRAIETFSRLVPPCFNGKLDERPGVGDGRHK